MEAEKEPYLADEGETNPVFEMLKHFDQVILLLRQAMNSCSYIRCFNALIFFVGDKKRVCSKTILQHSRILGTCYLGLSMRN